MTERLESTGVITVLVHRIKNLCAPRRSTHSASDKPHGITKFGLPEKAVKDLGLSHHGRYVHFSPLLPLRLISCPVSTGRSKKNPASDRSATTPLMAEKTSMLSQSFTSSTGRWVSHPHSIIDLLLTLSLAILQSLGIAPATPRPVMLPSRPRTPAAEPPSTPRQVYPTPQTPGDQPGLSTPELLVLMRAYRGSVDGLEGSDDPP